MHTVGNSKQQARKSPLEITTTPLKPLAFIGNQHKASTKKGRVR